MSLIVSGALNITSLAQSSVTERQKEEPTPQTGVLTEVVGEVKSKSSQLTEDQDFIFTDYEIQVEEVIKNNTSDSIAPNTEITVSNPGRSFNWSAHR